MDNKLIPKYTYKHRFRDDTENDMRADDYLTLYKITVYKLNIILCR